jgi:hypothetical protein
MATSLAGLGLLLFGPAALAQQLPAAAPRGATNLPAPSAVVAANQPSPPMVLLQPASAGASNQGPLVIQVTPAAGLQGDAAPPGGVVIAPDPASCQASQALVMRPLVPPPGSPRTESDLRDQISRIRQAQAQGADMRAPGERGEYTIQLEPPGPNRLFRRDSEPTLQERMRQEARDREGVERIVFPDEPQLTTESYVARVFAPTQETVEPNYVCYQRLLFEQKNLERGGWDLGIFTPVASAGKFFWDVVVLPYNVWTRPFQPCECSAGYCLPGDPMPLLLYPPELSLTGAIMEAGTVVGLVAIFPG